MMKKQQSNEKNISIESDSVGGNSYLGFGSARNMHTEYNTDL